MKKHTRKYALTPTTIGTLSNAELRRVDGGRLLPPDRIRTGNCQVDDPGHEI